MRRRHLAPALLGVLVLAGVAVARHRSMPVQPDGTTAMPSASLVVLNARVWTGDPAQPRAEAFAVAGDRFIAVGSTAVIRKYVRSGDGGSAPEVVDAAGRFIAPGFIDAHVHFLAGGARLSGVQLRDARSRDEFVARIRDYAARVPPGTWITGGDWDHELWGGQLPHRQWIDTVTTEHPVWVSRLDGHMALANSLALRLAGVTAATPDVEGGTIERDASGEPTGLLRDNAMSLVERVVPPPTDRQQDEALAAAMQHVASHGVTSVHHMGTFADLEVFERHRAAGRLTTRIYAAVPLAEWARLRDHVARAGRGDAWLRWGLLKGFVDGSLGSHTAAFEAPYTDAPTDRGLLVTSERDLHEWIAAADRAGLHVAVHAIGDRANRLLLDIYERVIRDHGPRDRRFRIEHAQHLAPADIARFAPLGVIASMQPYHAIDDGRWADRVIGPERARTTYAFRSLIDAGAQLAFGSDWYVAPPSVIEGIYAAVTRRTLDGQHPGGWVPEQRITAEEALRAYTVGAARAAFEEHEKGSIAAGRLADFVMLDRDPTAIPGDRIRETQVVATAVGGRFVYRR